MIDALRARRGELVDDAVRAVRGAIPSYARVEDAAFEADLKTHLDAHYGAMLRSLADGRAPAHDEMLFVRPHATRRVGQIPLVDFMQSFRVYQEVLWRATLELAAELELADAALSIVGTMLDYHNVAAAHAGELYVEAERLLQSQGDKVRRELLDDLLAGWPVAPGPRQEAARAAGLDRCCGCLVIVALPTAEPPLEHVMRSAVASLARAIGAELPPLAAVRVQEIVIVAPAGRADPVELAASLDAAQRRLAGQGVQLAVGVSTIQERIDGVPAAYREALSASERARPDGGVVALPALRAFEYLTRFSHETVRRLVPASIRSFVDEDVAEGGILTTTLLAYVASDLNVKAAAERLHLHANTAHYRLARIEERTGCKVRRLPDILDLLIAVQAARVGPEPVLS